MGNIYLPQHSLYHSSLSSIAAVYPPSTSPALQKFPTCIAHRDPSARSPWLQMQHPSRQASSSAQPSRCLTLRHRQSSSISSSLPITTCFSPSCSRPGPLSSSGSHLLTLVSARSSVY